MDGRQLDDVTLETKYDRRRYPWDEMRPGDVFDVVRYEHDTSIEALRNTVATASRSASRKTGHRYHVTITSAGRVSVHCLKTEPAKAFEDGDGMRYFRLDDPLLVKRLKVPYRNDAERTDIGKRLMSELYRLDAELSQGVVPHVFEDDDAGCFIISAMPMDPEHRAGALYSEEHFAQAFVQGVARKRYSDLAMVDMVRIADQVSYQFGVNRTTGVKQPESFAISRNEYGHIIVTDKTDYGIAAHPDAEPF